MANSSDFHKAIEEYQTKYRNDDLPPFQISDIYPVNGEWENGYIPFAEKCGCYIFYDANENICYIGKASLNSTLGIRVSSYFNWKEGASLRHKWTCPPVSAQVVVVTEPFEAPSLEEFLIYRLNPSDNIRKGAVGVKES